MRYFISFLEGIITFISPCLLPMLPVYVTYFAGAGAAGQSTGSQAKKGALSGLGRALAFVAGFTLVFCLMGAFAGAIGSFLARWQTAFNIVTGVIVVFFGLQYLELLPFKLFRGGTGGGGKIGRLPGLLSAFLFGIIFSIGWTPCVGAFLGSALMLASQSGSAAQGILMLLFYSLGLGLPFTAAALLLEKLTAAFAFIKRHYRVINIVCGLFLVLTGVAMATGLFGRLLGLLSLQ